ncbi:hypothetical protein PHJA_002959200 [Phtheirospermum japonicum]|uniref:Bifunctional inhibitor/plant lipid transfer protein/seed storage helical domain-containing protein n=1 Tax=Phtheirospermum japonicum TaxID=374723 RepID=A0A830DR25_9LAMI|nr:hypothetical protein PHJA_002959200 [Phtheirospermum japonicum]
MVQESKGHPCGSTFFSALVHLIPCRAAVAPFSPIPPSESCCASVKALGQPCLCVLVNGPPISGVDRTMAMQLPEKCTANFEPCTNFDFFFLNYNSNNNHPFCFKYKNLLFVQVKWQNEKIREREKGKNKWALRAKK